MGNQTYKSSATKKGENKSKIRVSQSKQALKFKAIDLPKLDPIFDQIDNKQRDLGRNQMGKEVCASIWKLID